MLKAWVTRLVTFAAGRAGLTAALGLLLAAAALAYAATHFAITTDSAALISPKVAWRQDEARLSKAFPQQNDLTVVVVDGRTPELAEDAAARLADRLAADKAHFLNVRRPDGGPFFAREGLLLRSTEEVRATTEGLVKAQPFLGPLAADPSLRGVASAFGTLAQGVQRGETRLAEVDRPLGKLADAFTAAAEGKPAFFSWQALVGGEGAPAARRVASS